MHYTFNITYTLGWYMPFSIISILMRSSKRLFRISSGWLLNGCQTFKCTNQQQTLASACTIHTHGLTHMCMCIHSHSMSVHARTWYTHVGQHSWLELHGTCFQEDSQRMGSQVSVPNKLVYILIIMTVMIKQIFGSPQDQYI